MKRLLLFAVAAFQVIGCDSGPAETHADGPAAPVAYSFQTAFTHSRDDIPLSYEYQVDAEIEIVFDDRDLSGSGSCTYEGAVIGNGIRTEVGGIEDLFITGSINGNELVVSFTGCSLQITRNNVDRPFTGVRSTGRITLERVTSVYSEIGQNVRTSYTGQDPWTLILREVDP